MYPVRPIYLTWGGTLGAGGLDIWQCGVHLTSTSNVDIPVPSAAALQSLFTDTLVPFHSDINTGISDAAVLSWVKAVRLKVDGKYDTEAVEYQASPGTAGAVAQDRCAPSESMVISMWSGGKLGRANYGRIYLPWNAIPTARSTGKISAGAQSNLLLVATNLFSEINTWAASAIALTPAVRIRILSAVETGAQKEPAFLRVGDVVDTQRRRRNRIAETYATVAWPI